MKKVHLFKEAIITTLIVLVTTFFISFIPWSLEYAKALHQGFADFDIYDVYYLGNKQISNNRDPDIILVELGNNRSEIENQI